MEQARSALKEFDNLEVRVGAGERLEAEDGSVHLVSVCQEGGIFFWNFERKLGILIRKQLLTFKNLKFILKLTNFNLFSA